jgi:hypothetical protein
MITIPIFLEYSAGGFNGWKISIEGSSVDRYGSVERSLKLPRKKRDKDVLAVLIKKISLQPEILF